MTTQNPPKEKPEIVPPVTPVEPVHIPEITPIPGREDQPETHPEIPAPQPEQQPEKEAQHNMHVISQVIS